MEIELPSFPGSARSFTAGAASTTVGTTTQDRQLLHLKAIKIDFDGSHPDCEIVVKVKIDEELKESRTFSQGSEINWEKDMCIPTFLNRMVVTICKVQFGIQRQHASISVDLKDISVKGGGTLTVSSGHQPARAMLTFGAVLDVTHALELLRNNAQDALANKVVLLDRIAEFSAFAGNVMDVTAKIVEIGTAVADVNNIAKSAFGAADLAFKKLQQQRDCHRAAVDLMETLGDSLPFTDIIPENMRSAQIRNALRSLLGVEEEALRFVIKYSKISALKDLLSSRQDKIRELKERIKDKLAIFHASLAAQGLVVLNDVQATVQNPDRNKALDKLKPDAAAQHSEGSPCMEGTREAPLGQIMTWSNSASSSGLFWTHGLAGSGKSTIAATIHERFRGKGMLGGAFFCKRDVPEQRDPKKILPTLSSMLTKLHKPYRDRMVEILEKEDDISASPIAYQLSTLFTTPCSSLQDRDGCLVFVIDALDECGDSSSRSQIADCLCHIASLSNWLKVFVTSRPQPEFARKLSGNPSIAALDLNRVDVKNDIVRYTKSCLEELVSSHDLDEIWLGNEFVMALAERAGGLFIWTSTVMKFVAGQFDKDGAMEKIQSERDSDPKANLDALYMTVLQASDGGSDGENAALLKAVLGIIYITAKNRPLSIDGLHSFVPTVNGKGKFSKKTLKAVLSALRSVLYKDDSQGGVIRVCHPSFLDFLEDHRRCGIYWTNSEQLNQAMIEKCLNLMRTELKFNICSLESSHVANESVRDLQQRIRGRITESLQYSCLYWVTHFTQVDQDTVHQIVSEFFEDVRVLYWLEVLSLIGGLKEGLDVLQTIVDTYHDRTRICDVARDAHRVLSSAYDAINYSTPHLYVSVLTWLPEESPLHPLLYPYFESQPLLLTGRHREWHRARWINAMRGPVKQIAFSPDGRNVAACSEDKTVCIWEARTELMVTKLKGHTDGVLGVAFSADGGQLVSGSMDCTVRIWDAETGIEATCMKGHTDSVGSVCYSSDGKFITSRSNDETVRIWDSASRTEVKKLSGHCSRGYVVYSPDGRKLACCGEEGIEVYDTESGELLGEVDGVCEVGCVAYSSDGKYLASGCADYIVRIWDGETLAEVAVLRKHTSYIYSVAFSPDGSELLSASSDATLIRWNMTSFKMISTPFRAHETTIYSAMYSPDGRSIASGSWDNSVRLWDVDSMSNADSDSQLSTVLAVACSPNGNEFASATSDGSVRIHDASSGTVLRTLAGHSDQVRDLAYNSNGILLASGSDDHTIIIWDTEAGTEQQKLEGHTALVTSVVFTLDGQHLVSASGDGTVRCWRVDSGDGKRILLSHSDGVNSVCLSSDGKLLASGGTDNTIRFSDPETGTDIGQRCTSDGVIRALAFWPDGKYVASSSENAKIQIWDVDSRTEVRRLEGHIDYVLSVAFSHDGKQILSSAGDTTVRQWDLETGAELRKLKGHPHGIRRAVYSADEERIISGSSEGTVRIWGSDAMQNGYVAELDEELPSLPLVDGWIKSRNGELLLWVPPEYRNGIRGMCEVCIPADAPGHPVRLDWAKLVEFKGQKWTGILKDASREA